MNDRIDGRSDRTEQQRSPSLMRLFGQMVMLPFTAFVQSMDLFIKTIQGMQKATDDGIDRMMGETSPVADQAVADAGDFASDEINSVTGGVIKDKAAPNLKEKINMSDTDLSGKDTLKLVRYKILFIKRDYETAFPEREELVADSLDATGYTAWKIAEFIQTLGRKKTEVPSKWKSYPVNLDPPEPPYRENGILLGLPEEDKKYLRVYFEVLDRYDREEAKYEQQQINVLKEIRDRI